MAVDHPSSSGTTRLLLEFLCQNPVIAALVTLAAFVATVALLFGVPSSKHQHGSATPPSMPGYWLPFIGHGLQFLLNRTEFLARLKKQYPEGIFSLVMLGSKHHVIHEPLLSGTLINRPRTTIEEKWLAARMLTKTFGLRKEDQSTYSSLAHETPELFKHLLSEPGLSNLVDAMVDQISNHIADFVTFNSSEADQMDWERSAGVEIVEGTKGQTFAETDLMSLVRNFVAKTANPALFGTDFVENSPEFWELLWKFDEGIVPMAADVPAWIPWPRVQRARAAQRAMLARTREFEVAMDKHLSGEDPGPRWQDMDNISEYVKSRIGLFKAHGLSLEARASCDLALAWAMNANANTLIAWLLFELYRDPVLLEVVREEIASFVRFEQPENDFGPAVWVAPKLEEPDVDGLINDCPHLKAAYLETLRIYTGIWTVKKLTEDVVLERRGKHAETYLLQKGHMAHLAHELHQFDAEYFDSPHEWRHDRFLKASGGQTVQLAGTSTLRPFGGGPTMCKGRALALREMLLYTSVIISLYDMVPPHGGSWGDPQTNKRAATRYPTKPIKVWIKRRNISTVTAKVEH